MKVENKTATFRRLAELRVEANELIKSFDELKNKCEELGRAKKFKELNLIFDIWDEKIKKLKKIETELRIILLAYKKGGSNESSRN